MADGISCRSCNVDTRDEIIKEWTHRQIAVSERYEIAALTLFVSGSADSQGWMPLRRARCPGDP